MKLSYWSLAVVSFLPLTALAQDNAAANSVQSAAQTVFAPWAGSDRVQTELQLGVDAWSLHPSVEEDTEANLFGNKRLYLANSATVWPYQSTAPWVRFQSQWRATSSTQLTFKYRADQNLGSRVDELNVDQSFHKLGVRVGVLDYKLSWCRTYEAYSPWMRESNYLCSTFEANSLVGGAPGIQLYGNVPTQSFRWQALVGVYDPLMWYYNPTEFGNTLLFDQGTVTQNHKWGASINGTGIDNSLELRLSVMNTDQRANFRGRDIRDTYQIQGKDQTIYAALGYQLTPAVGLRLSRLQATSQETAVYPNGYTRPDDTYPQTRWDHYSPKTSNVLELDYQNGTGDTFGLAYSRYTRYADFTNYQIYPPSSDVVAASYPGYWRIRNQSLALSWRRDWNKSLFTVLQWTGSWTEAGANYPGVTPEANSQGHSVGLRLGYTL